MNAKKILLVVTLGIFLFLCMLCYELTQSVWTSILLAGLGIGWIFFKIKPSIGYSKQKKYDEINHRYFLTFLQTVFWKWRFSQVFPNWSYFQHSILVGQSGSGKSEFSKFRILNRIQNFGSTILIDAHGDLANEVARFKFFETNPQNLVYISGEFLDDGLTINLCPLEHDFHDLAPHQKFSRLSVKVQDLTTAFESLFRQNLTHHQKSLLKNAFHLLLEQDKPSLLDLLELTIPANRDKYRELARHHSLPHVREYFEKVYPSSSLDITMYSISGRLTDIFDSFAVRNLIGGRSSTVDLESLLNSNKTVIFNLSQGVFGKDGVRLIGSMILAMIGDVALKRSESDFRPPVSVFADECSLYVTSTVSRYLDEARKYNIFFHLMTQRLSQFQGDGLKKLKEAVLSTGIRMVGHSALKDVKTFCNEMEIDVKEIKPRLTTGVLLIQTGQKKPIVYRSPDFLITSPKRPLNNHPQYLNDVTWKNILGQQQRRFYIRLSSLTANTSQNSSPKPQIPSLL